MIHHTSNETTARSIATLTRREPHVDETPIIGPRGRFSFRGRTVYLSERNAILAGVFVYHFGAEVSDVELLERVPGPTAPPATRFGGNCADSSADSSASVSRSSTRATARTCSVPSNSSEVGRERLAAQSTSGSR